MLPSTKFSIRPAAIADAPALAAFAARTFLESFGADTNPADMEQFLSQTYSATIQGAEIRDSAVATLLAEIDGQLAGFCQVREARPPDCVATHIGGNGRILEIGRFYVDARWHGSGLAPRLMQSALDNARIRGALHVWLGVFERNVRAQRFYAKCGFATIGKYIFQVGSDPQRDLILLAPVPAA